MTTIQRTAVLTGATSERGIGLTTARRYAAQGWGIVILDLDGEKSAKVAAEIGNEFNVPAFGYEINVADEASVTKAQAAVAAAGALDEAGLRQGLRHLHQVVARDAIAPRRFLDRVQLVRLNGQEHQQAQCEVRVQGQPHGSISAHR